MREIKFRAWDTSSNPATMLGPYDITDSIFNHKEIRSLELMQFTGCHDKNLTEIYEGDIIKWRFVNTGEDEPEYTELVKWDECGFFLDGGAPLTVAIDDCEVIGNIYGNH